MAAALLVLWLQVHNQAWLNHIVVDPVVYWNRASYFLQHGGSWVALGVNEYQPGALWFFVAVSGLAGGVVEFDTFLQALIAANLALIALHVILAWRFGSRSSAYSMLLFAVASGPILLCRFELVVSALILGAWIFWRRGRFVSAGLLLGLATATKVYPVLLFPLLLASAFSDSGIRASLRAAGAWFGGGFLAVGALGLFGARWENVVDAMRFHFDKPFGIEGVLGGGIPLVQALLGIPLRMAPRNGIYGFESDLGAAATFLLEWLWLPAAAAVIILLLRTRCAAKFSEAGALFILFGWYVALGKLMAPQYTWWALSLLPMASADCFTRRERVAVASLAVACLLLGQVVYPLNYSEFIKCFDGDFLFNRLFWFNALKNLLWVAALAVATKALLRNTSDARRCPV